MKPEQKFLICLFLLRDFKVKQQEKIFSKYLLFVYYLLDILFLKWNILSNLYKTINLEITQKVFFFGQVVFCKTPAGDYFWWFYKKKCLQKFFWVLCFKSSPKEVFYYKGFLQMCSKFTVELPCWNISFETHLNCRVMLLKGALFFCLFWGNQCVLTSKPNWILWKKTKVWKKEIETFASLFI